MDEVELDLLERRARPGTARRSARSGAGPVERQPAGDADHQLLADADVDHPVRVPARGRREPAGGDVGQHDRDARVVVEQLGGGVDEALPHGRSSLAPRRRRRAAGPGWRPRARARSRRGRGRRPSRAVQPLTANRLAMPPGQPWVADCVVDDDRRSGRRGRRGRRTRSPRGSSPRPARRRRAGTKTRGAVRALGAQPERDADGEREAVAERAGARSPRRGPAPVGVVAERRVEPPKPSSQPRGKKPRRRAPRSRPAARGPSRAGSGRGRGRRRIGRVDPQHAVVEHPAARRGWRRRSARASRRRSRRVSSEVAEPSGSRQCMSLRLELQVHLKSSGVMRRALTDRRAGRAQRRRDRRRCASTSAGADRRRAHRRQPAPLRAGQLRRVALSRPQRAGVPLRARSARRWRRCRTTARRRSATGRGSRAAGAADLDEQIAELEALRDDLTGCIGCGCLSLRSCRLFNPGDRLAEAGPRPTHPARLRALPGGQPTRRRPATIPPWRSSSGSCARPRGVRARSSARGPRARYGALATAFWVQVAGIRSSSRWRSAPACPTRRATTGCWRRIAGVAYLGGSACWTFAVRLGAVGIVTMLVATDGAIAATRLGASWARRSACRSRSGSRSSCPACCSPRGPAKHAHVTGAAVALGLLGAASFATVFVAGGNAEGLSLAWVLLVARVIATSACCRSRSRCGPASREPRSATWA